MDWRYADLCPCPNCRRYDTLNGFREIRDTETKQWMCEYCGAKSSLAGISAICTPKLVLDRAKDFCMDDRDFRPLEEMVK